MKTLLKLLCTSYVTLLLLAVHSPATAGERQAATRLYGVVSDEEGRGLPFATVHIKNTSTGTTTNQDGRYSISLPPGTYRILYQFVGYKTQEREVRIAATPVALDVSLEPETYELSEVVISSGDEDPAYAVIRAAIARRKQHLNEVEAFSAEVYIKGLQRLDKKQDKILGIEVNVDTGIVYLSESVSEYHVQRPNNVKEVMISSKVSGNDRGFSWNQASDMRFNFYENLLSFPGLSERGFVSPIADNALFFYDYELEGTFREDNYLINKIKLIPKRQHDPVFRGHIYIVEDLWRIHSTDLQLTKESQVEFVDTLNINQVFAPIEDNAWMVLSQSFTFNFKIFGFEGSGYFIGVYRDYEIAPDFEKGFFNNEVLRVEREANKRDSSYWDNVRPVPLTQLEVSDYVRKDSIQQVKESKPYLDSVDRKNNRISPGDIFLSGYTWRNSFKKREVRFPSLFRLFQYNTVEGYVLDIAPSFRQEYEDRRSYTITPVVRVSSDDGVRGKVEATYNYNPRKFASASFSAGKYIAQYNYQDPVPYWLNTFYTLLNEENYLRIYDHTFASYTHGIEPVNGIYLRATLEYGQRRELFNKATDVWVDREDRELQPNRPQNAFTDTYFPEHEALTLRFTARFRFAQKYVSRPDFKYITESRYPSLYLTYMKGIKGVFGSDTDFDRLSLSVVGEQAFGLLGKTDYTLAAGTFLRAPVLYFMDYKHFMGNQFIPTDFGPGKFQLLDYYTYSTNDTYYQGHFTHHFNGFLLNKIPHIRNLKWQTVLTANWFHTREAGHYAELGLGIEHIFKVVRVDGYRNFEPDGSNRYGVRVGIGF
ncbi:DUF5686 and carboxypeptidase regulatory-like domain-containing protein [Roseivirga sp. BDSF3-8]|uniref:DUF5686 and carboxypeptidase regulatory-like domain-containing protein n=1 Tax=Roseivirga sp. BDSF3-8 TaxID=3241598 RepID=UPI0035323417